MNGIGPQGAGYTGIGVTGQDVLIYGNLLVTGAIDPTSLSLSPTLSGPQGSIWYDTNNYIRLEKEKLTSTSSSIFSNTLEEKYIEISNGATASAYFGLDSTTGLNPYLSVRTLEPSINYTSQSQIISAGGTGTSLPKVELKHTDNNTTLYQQMDFTVNYQDFFDSIGGSSISKYQFKKNGTEVFGYYDNRVELLSGIKLVLADNTATLSTSLSLAGSANRSITNLTTVTGYQGVDIVTGLDSSNLTIQGGRAGSTGGYGTGGTNIISGLGNCNFYVATSTSASTNSLTVNTDGFALPTPTTLANWTTSTAALPLGTASYNAFSVNITSAPLAANSITPTVGVNGGSYTLKITNAAVVAVTINASKFSSLCKISTASVLPLSVGINDTVLFKIYYDGSNYYINIEQY